MRFSKVEIRELVIAWFVLGFCISFSYLIKSPSGFPLFFAVALITLGAGFVFHEISHKLTAQRFGYRAEFRLWRIGLIIAIVSALISLGQFLFFAPGAVYTSTHRLPNDREEGLISAAGPAANIALAGIFYILTFYSGLLALIGSFGFTINLWLAAFNLIPFPPLDGFKIFSWNKPVWILLAVIAWGLLALTMFHVI